MPRRSRLHPKRIVRPNIFFGVDFDVPAAIEALLWKEGDNAKHLSAARLFPAVDDLGTAKLDGFFEWWCSECRFHDDFIVANVDWFVLWRNARRVSLEELAGSIDISVEVAWQKRVSFLVDEARVTRTLRSRAHVSTRPLYERMAREGHMGMLQTLDSLLMDASIGDDVAARAMASVADLLYSFVPSGFWGLRSGPARNKLFLPAFDALESGNRAGAVAMMIEARKQWLGSDSKKFRSQSTVAKSLIRAARHYEGAASILIRRAVSTASKFISSNVYELPPPDAWISAESGVRIDIAGGWTDTPPISYEAGGAVTNIAVLLDGKRPLGCKARRTKREAGASLIKFNLVGLGETHCSTLDDMRDYCRPSAPAALLKAAILCVGIVSLEPGAPSLSKHSLKRN